MSAALRAYCPYGHHRNQVSKVSMLGFNGEREDSLTGNYLLGNGYRAYSPGLRRFLAPDSWSPFGKGGVNAYSYCAGDSINDVDPDGHAGFNRIRRHPTILTADAPPPQTAQHLNRSLNRQRLQTGNNSHTDPSPPTPNNQQPRANRNPLANGGRMPFEDRRNPSVTLGEVVTLARELHEANLALARAPEYLKQLHNPEMRSEYLASLARIRREVPKQEDRVNRAMASWFHS
ncbi:MULTISPECIES: RHS repeat-associated core domain-containing protein [Pseudomonas]|uniref:RHS repeat-associated core domain-containing protein n=1 Tax=Pseudomonas juntendi TaxID=2666183 RepID=A0A7W2LTK5_9PSED|nr:RHS repeat-associated core domain-containing protein [Pseudomonas juntendi]MBA6146807.1 RHS repeat-associated core domain-containing protein [Pseudomonas juntendi]MRT59861.1 RHS repeat-associated core domain-containing protein [Pseudomonas sp. CAH-1]